MSKTDDERLLEALNAEIARQDGVTAFLGKVFDKMGGEEAVEDSDDFMDKFLEAVYETDKEDPLT